MTPQEITSNAKYQSALIRAEKKGIAILARATDKQGAFLGCLVQGETAQYHVTNDGNKLHCDCIAGQRGSYCVHRAIVTKAEMDRAAQAAQEELPDDTLYERAVYAEDWRYPDPAYDSTPAEPIIVRNDTGPRLYRETPVLAERVKEAM